MSRAALEGSGAGSQDETPPAGAEQPQAGNARVPVHTVGDSGSLDDLEARAATGPSPVGAYASSVAVPPHSTAAEPPRAAAGEPVCLPGPAAFCPSLLPQAPPLWELRLPQPHCGPPHMQQKPRRRQVHPTLLHGNRGIVPASLCVIWSPERPQVPPFVGTCADPAATPPHSSAAGPTPKRHVRPAARACMSACGGCISAKSVGVAGPAV